MAKFCGNCGTQSDDNAMVCGNCGAPFAEEANGTGKDILSKIPGVNDMSDEQKKKIFGILKIAVPAVLAVVLVLVVIFAGIVPNVGYKGTAKKFFKAVQNEDGEAFVELMPAAEKIEDDYYLDEDQDFDEYLKEEAEDTCALLLEYFEDDYGNDIKFSIKDIQADELKNSEAREIKDYYKENEDLDNIELGEKFYELELEIQVKGSDDKDTEDFVLVLIEEDGDWKVWDYDID